MNLYWIYDLETWQLGASTVAVFVVVALTGLFITRPIMRWFLKGAPTHNDIVSFFFAGVGVFYGLAVGLIAVATWEDYNSIVSMVSKEGADLAELYRDLDGYPAPLRTQLEQELRTYTQFIVEKDWPAHRRGDVPEEGTQLLDQFENLLMAFEPSTEREKIVHAEALRTLDSIVEQRRLRLESVSTGLPVALWAIVLIGAWLNLAFTYLFWVENFRLHVLLVALFATFMALLVFVTAAMDNPFRGEISVSPDVFKDVLTKVMKPAGGG
jgi:hypothetical protein